MSDKAEGEMLNHENEMMAKFKAEREARKGTSKQIIVVRKDLRNAKGEKIRTGKLIAQGAHASMKFILDSGNFYQAELDHPEQFHADLDKPHIKDWMNGIFTKICVSVDSEAELEEVYQKAKAAGLISSMIVDAGLTEFGGVPTKTCCAIGPNWSDEIDPITKHLPLL